jgi:hypothetical protein
MTLSPSAMVSKMVVCASGNPANSLLKNARPLRHLRAFRHHTMLDVLRAKMGKRNLQVSSIDAVGKLVNGTLFCSSRVDMAPPVDS